MTVSLRKSRPFIVAFSNQRKPELSGKVMQSGLRQNRDNLKCTLQFSTMITCLKEKKLGKDSRQFRHLIEDKKKGEQLLI